MVGIGQGGGVQPTQVRAPAHFALYQAGLLEGAHMLGRRCERHGEWLGQLAHRAFAARQRLQHAAPRRVAECVKDAVELTGCGGLIFNHEVENINACNDGQPFG